MIQLSNHKKINGSDLAALMMPSEQAHADVRAAITQALDTAVKCLKQAKDQLQEPDNEHRELKHSPPTGREDADLSAPVKTISLRPKQGSYTSSIDALTLQLQQL